MHYISILHSELIWFGFKMWFLGMLYGAGTMGLVFWFCKKDANPEMEIKVPTIVSKKVTLFKLQKSIKKLWSKEDDSE